MFPDGCLTILALSGAFVYAVLEIVLGF